MANCIETSRLEAYYDGELLPQFSGDVERHVRSCTECAGQLDELRELLTFLEGGRPEPIRDEEFRRIVMAVDESTDRSILRLGMSMLAMAASVLIISTVWLYDVPAPALPSTAQTEQPQPAWERMATNLHADPPGIAPAGAPERDTTEWMVDALQSH